VENLLSPETSARLERLVRLARRVRADRRRGALKQPGRGIEPGARRDYVPGDDLRRVDWPAYARLERLLIKVTEDLPESRIDLVLDGSPSMRCGAPSPAWRAALACAGVAAVATARDLRVGVWLSGPGAERLTLARPSELVRLLRFLARPREGEQGPSLADLGPELERVPRAGPVVFFSDGLDPDLESTAARLSRRRSVRVALIETERELAADQVAVLGEGARTELVDAESGARLVRALGPAGLASASADRAKRLRLLEAALEERGVGSLRLPPGDPFERLAEALLHLPA
jgi:uncharacterized protein (DUF58 family)